MPADRIVEPLDVVEDIGSRGVAGAIDLFADPLGLQRGEEALHRGVVPDVAGPAHRTDDAIVGHQTLELARSYIGCLGLNDAPERLAFRAARSPSRAHR